MGRKTTSLVVAVLWLLLVAEKCNGWGEEALEDVKDNVSKISENADLDEKAEAVKSGVSAAYSDAKDTAESWSNWAYDKISKGMGLNEEELKETAHFVVDKTGDAATKTTEKMNTVASDASSYASEKAGEAVEAASKLKSKSENAMGAAKEKAKETLVDGKDKAAEVYEAAKKEVGRKFEAAKENVNCETAKEKASQAAGEIGSRIREKTSEL